MSSCKWPEYQSQATIKHFGKPKGFGLAAIKQEGKLYAITRNSPNSFYIDRFDQKRGFDYELLKLFADSIGVELSIKSVDSTSEVLRQLSDGAVHLGAAGLSKTALRENIFEVGPVYDHADILAVCRKKIVPFDWEHSKLSIFATADSSYEELTESLEIDLGNQELQIAEDTTEELLEKTVQGEADCVLTDSRIFAQHAYLQPKLRVLKVLAKDRKISWLLAPGQLDLNQEIDRFFTEKRRSGFLGQLRDSYFGHAQEFDSYDIETFKRRVRNRLPKYRDLFIEAATSSPFSWYLLASVSYQESHWNPRAKSPTGVRGMMMLTGATAKEMGVKNLYDPKQSILGGAKYLTKLEKRIPPRVKGEDRIWMALAAYNVGYGHLRDARALAVLKDKDPFLWTDVRTMMPLLAQKKYYKFLPNGYARGREPVVYVKRIRSYLHTLMNIEKRVGPNSVNLTL